MRVCVCLREMEAWGVDKQQCLGLCLHGAASLWKRSRPPGQTPHGGDSQEAQRESRAAGPGDTQQLLEVRNHYCTLENAILF